MLELLQQSITAANEELVAQGVPDDDPDREVYLAMRAAWRLIDMKANAEMANWVLAWIMYQRFGYEKDRFMEWFDQAFAHEQHELSEQERSAIRRVVLDVLPYIEQTKPGGLDAIATLLIPGIKTKLPRLTAPFRKWVPDLERDPNAREAAATVTHAVIGVDENGAVNPARRVTRERLENMLAELGTRDFRVPRQELWIARVNGSPEDDRHVILIECDSWDSAQRVQRALAHDSLINEPRAADGIEELQRLLERLRGA